jgi:hypothetical protein
MLFAYLLIYLYIILVCASSCVNFIQLIDSAHGFTESVTGWKAYFLVHHRLVLLRCPFCYQVSPKGTNEPDHCCRFLT